MKTCTKCKQQKSIEYFVKSKWCSDGYRGTCKDCKNKKSRIEYEKNKEEIQKYSRAHALKKQYWPNLTRDAALEEYNRLLKSQNESCAICNQHQSAFKKPLFVDHCHITKKVRGLLCRDCNLGIGFLKADLGHYRLKKALVYLDDDTFE